ncbi:beta/gamma crystallin family protein [Hyphomonadaceae bacterium BL14]|nr:beta/gamma crystallin family protein [Hyphomonadaceae bacterium BL14]
MFTLMRLCAAAAAVVFAATSAADAQRGGRGPDRPAIVLYEHANFQGRSIRIDGDAPNFAWIDFNDRASSARVEGGQWDVCEHADYRGTCVSLTSDVAQFTGRLNSQISSVRAVHRQRPDSRQGVTFWSGPDYTGRAVTLTRPEDNFTRINFNDMARSVEVHSGSWTLCEHASYRGRCVELDRNSGDLARFRMQGIISSATPDGLPHSQPDPGWGGGAPGWGAYPGGIDGATQGVSSRFYARPETQGAAVAACITPGSLCGQPAADQMCQRAGMRRATWFSSEPWRGPVIHLGDNRRQQGGTVLIDVLCTY